MYILILMLKFDKMKLVTKIDYISDIDYSKFILNSKEDSILYYKYQQERPFYLLVMVNYQHNELVLEFTGKILLDNYVNLINIYTAKDCLSQINRLGFCHLNVDSIMEDCNVVKCDVTKDIECSPIQDITTNVRQNLSNYKKWITRPYHKEGITIENVVKTPRYKKRLIIYDKAKELQSADNRYFLNAVSNPNEILSYFNNKTRFELNINTMDQIRNLLNIPNNSLSAVLASAANPILSVIDEAIKYNDCQHRPMNLRDYEHCLLLKECNYDLNAVEAKVRTLSAKTTSITRVMKVYKDLYNQIQAKSAHNIDIRALVA